MNVKTRCNHLPCLRTRSLKNLFIQKMYAKFLFTMRFQLNLHLLVDI